MKRKKHKMRPVRPDSSLSRELARYWDLLDKFSDVPDYILDRTIMDISGYPHYENVCSNILAFYFDPQNEHGMGDLLLQSLLDCVEGSADRPVFEQAIIKREEPTKNNKRLDLLIDLDGLVIGIENKVYHDVNNPFDEYDALIKRCAGENKEAVKIILGLRKVDSADHRCGFVSITYLQWFDRLAEIMGQYLLTAEPKYQYYFFDFIKTMRRLSGESTMNEETIRFFKNNYRLVDELIGDYGSFKKELGNNIFALQAMVPVGDNQRIKQFVWQNLCLAHEFRIKTGTLVIDTYISPGGWEISFFCRQAGARDSLEKIKSCFEKQDGPLASSGSDGRYILAKFDLNASLDEVGKYLNDRIQFVVNVIDSDPELSVNIDEV